MNQDEIYQTPHEYYMQECFELASIALGKTSPNPIVGAVVLDKNGIPVGKGYHERAGANHAEIVALKQAGEKAVDGTLIINLEPCCHFGKTPPCTDQIIKSSIKEVVFSNHDINPIIQGKSEKILKDKGINVISSVLKKEGEELNRFFFKWIKSKIPWIALKQAQTLDGKIALKNKESKWISSEESRKEVHKLRSNFDAVLVGASTVVIDNPKLTVRNIEEGRNPTRIILDSNLISSPKSHVYENNAKVILVTTSGNPPNKIQEYLKINKNILIIESHKNSNNKLVLSEVFAKIGEMEILSVLLESGPTLAGEIIKEKLIDEYYLFISPRIFADSTAVPSVLIGSLEAINNSSEFSLINYNVIGNDLMLQLRPH